MCVPFYKLKFWKTICVNFPYPWRPLGHPVYIKLHICCLLDLCIKNGTCNNNPWSQNDFITNEKPLFFPHISGKIYGRIDQSFIHTAPTLVSEGKELEIKGKTHLALNHQESYLSKDFNTTVYQWMSPHTPSYKSFLCYSVEQFIYTDGDRYERLGHWK